jgi:RNA polymerase sigma-70 factor (ECF subfamily)
MREGPTSIDERWLVLKAQAGDPEAMNRLLSGIAPALTRFIGRIAGESREDVCQDVLLTIARKLTWLDEPAAFRPWAYRIASRAALKYAAREKRVWPFESVGEIVESLAATEPPSPDFLDRIPDLLSRLSPRSRVVLALHYLEELRLEDVAAVLDIPLGPVKSRLAFGLRQLREHVRKEPL